jgi:triphosphatase
LRPRKERVVIEMELKVDLDPAGEASVRRLLRQSPMREGPVRARSLVSIYCDTPDFDLARAGIALRLRKNGRGWVQTVKRRAPETGRGLFAAEELDRPAPGGRLRLDFEDEGGVYDAIRSSLNGAEPGPVFETRVRRTTALLRVEQGLVEVAIDRGELIAGALSAPIREAELELVEGGVGAIFAAARALFPEGPLRFSNEPKSARGLRLARTGRAGGPAAPRRALPATYPSNATVESAARAALRECLAQVADNMAVVAVSDDAEGPHQLRVGLRRLRAAFALFKRPLGDVFGPLNAAARHLGRIAGPVRDLDVFLEETIDGPAGEGIDAAARDALRSALEARRDEARAALRAAVCAPAAAAFLLDLAEMIEARGWLDPVDGGQSARLAAPASDVLPALVEKRFNKALKRGRRIDELDLEALHDLRKRLKTLRYVEEFAAPTLPETPTRKHLKALRRLQETFGALNDRAAAAVLLLGHDAPGGGDAAAQRAAGWVAGRVALQAEARIARLGAEWRRFRSRTPPWG